MGLPSGVQWASCNVGAEEASDLGMYFSWGNIEGHRIDEGYDFSQAVYDSTPAAAIDTNLSLDQDAARSNMGEPWRMPTEAEFQELNENCTSVWTTQNGVYGRLFTSNLNGRTLFFPAAGYYNGTSLRDRGSMCYYWSTKYTSAANAHRVRFDSTNVYIIGSSSRYFGLCVRAVLQLT